MATEAGQEIPPKPAGRRTFSETMNCYFATESALYEEKSRDPNGGMVQLLQPVVDALRHELIEIADAKGVGEDLRSAIRVEEAVEAHTLWIRTTAGELQDSRLLSLLSGSLLLGYAVSFTAYDILDMDWLPALLLGHVIISLGFYLPWLMDILATYKERQLRELRRTEDDPPNEWWTRGSTILHIT